MINKPTITPTPVECKPTIDNDANQYIGAQIPPYPDEFEEKGGALVESSDGPRYDYGLDYLSNGSIQMVWFSQSLGYRDADGHIVWTVIDTLSLPKLKSGEAVALLTCYHDGKYDREIFAIFSEPRNYIAVQAWRANRQTCKIEPISSDGIVCPP